ncbi:unnamed protein product [Darwinula stevensoni]|uniref:Uncharacterized protein n=1 Tax=Darwinula stevensoni TaxID=69355 RepID=A0A7R8X3J4_9CRUS|nr:unnamed protein product [Darwinula stevensoni]CAG0885027.1 unnamed protein product [Darwinula stevensoni]
MEVAKKGSHDLPPDDHSENLHATPYVPFWRKRTPDRYDIDDKPFSPPSPNEMYLETHWKGKRKENAGGALGVIEPQRSRRGSVKVLDPEKGMVELEYLKDAGHQEIQSNKEEGQHHEHPSDLTAVVEQLQMKLPKLSVPETSLHLVEKTAGFAPMVEPWKKSSKHPTSAGVIEGEVKPLVVRQLVPPNAFFSRRSTSPEGGSLSYLANLFRASEKNPEQSTASAIMLKPAIATVESREKKLAVKGESEIQSIELPKPTTLKKSLSYDELKMPEKQQKPRMTPKPSHLREVNMFAPISS